MKRVLCLVTVLGLLLSVQAFAHDMTDHGIEVKAYKVFNFDDLGLSISVAPTMPQLDTSLAFDRVDSVASGLVTFAQWERLHYRLLDTGAALLTS